MLAQLAGCSREPAAAPTLTLSDVSASVRLNMTAYTNRIARGKVPMNKQAQLQAAKARFDIAYRLALEASMGDTRFPAQGDVVKIAEEIGYLTQQP
jgi:hypothetical protein